jgi:hypothetical protein
LASVFTIGAAYGCGGGGKPPATTATNTTDSAAQMASASAPVASGAASSMASAAPASTKSREELAEDAPYEDATEKNHEKDGPIEMTALIAKNPPKSLFPKSTTGDHECLSGLAFTGNHKADYDTLIKQCGTPTGLVKYVEPAEGKLHATKDKRDVFSLDVRKGMCYRYFAVADR